MHVWRCALPYISPAFLLAFSMAFIRCAVSVLRQRHVRLTHWCVLGRRVGRQDRGFGTPKGSEPNRWGAVLVFVVVFAGC